jgi:hypothetical protein
VGVGVGVGVGGGGFRSLRHISSHRISDVPRQSKPVRPDLENMTLHQVLLLEP